MTTLTTVQREQIAQWGHDVFNNKLHPLRLADNVAQLLAPMRHVGECATDELSRQVCEGMYQDRCDDNRALCEALRAVYSLCGENKEIAKIVHDAIRKHGIDHA